jgi:hypothetical protein
MSCCCRRAFVNIFGGGNLGAFRWDHMQFRLSTHDSSAIDCAQSEICSKCASRSVITAVIYDPLACNAMRGVYRL